MFLLYHVGVLAQKHGAHYVVMPILPWSTWCLPSKQTPHLQDRASFNAFAEEGDTKRLLGFMEDGFLGSYTPHNTERDSPLHKAASRGRTQVIKLLLEFGLKADLVRVDDDLNRSALHVAVKHGHYLAAQALIAGGCNPDIADREGNTPLSTAADEGLESLAKLLIDAGANPNYYNEDGLTQIAQALRKGYQKLTLLLLTVGQRIDEESLDYHFQEYVRSLGFEKFLNPEEPQATLDWSVIDKASLQHPSSLRKVLRVAPILGTACGQTFEEKLLRHALKSSSGLDPRLEAALSIRLAEVLLKHPSVEDGVREEVAGLTKRALEIRAKTLGPGHPSTRSLASSSHLTLVSDTLRSSSICMPLM